MRESSVKHEQIETGRKSFRKSTILAQILKKKSIFQKISFSRFKIGNSKLYVGISPDSNFATAISHVVVVVLLLVVAARLAYYIL